jgi:hypothetical protein
MKRSSPNEEEKEKLMAAFKAFKEAKKKIGSNSQAAVEAVDKFERQVENIYNEPPKTKAKSKSSSRSSSSRLPPPRRGAIHGDRVMKKVKKKIKRVSKKKK